MCRVRKYRPDLVGRNMMRRKLTVEEVREYWTQQAAEHGQSPSASWSDFRAIEMEINEILKHLDDGDKVLDAGCGNGYSTLRFAANRRIHIRGIDCIQGMIQEARKRAEAQRGKILSDVEFAVDDITALKESSNAYDKVVVIRVIINLGPWQNQIKGLRECARVLKPKGILLLSEATLQGWKNMNRFRAEWGLPAIPVPPFNNYVDEDSVVNCLAGICKLLSIENFASTYYVGTRLLKPLLIQALGAKIDVAIPDMEWNRWFSQLPPWGDYGTQKLFVFQKD